MAVVKNVKVKARFSVLVTELKYKGNSQNRPGRDGPQQKIVIDSPVYVLPETEFIQRKGDVAKVVNHGWQLIEADPPEVWIGDISVTPAGVISCSGKVKSNNVATTCGFYIAIDPEMDTEILSAADESPIQSEDDEIITLDYNLGDFPGYLFYIRAYANDGTKEVYSIIKTIEIPVP